MRPALSVVMIGFAFYLFCGPAVAVYKCTALDGSVSYSDMPCGNGNKSASIKVPVNPPREVAPKSETPATPVAGTDRPQPTGAAAIEEKVRQSQRERARRDLEWRIDRHRIEIDSLMSAQDREIATLQATKRRANNNLAGAVWEQSLATEMNAVAQKYRNKIQAEQGAMERAQRELETLR